MLRNLFRPDELGRVSTENPATTGMDHIQTPAQGSTAPPKPSTAQTTFQTNAALKSYPNQSSSSTATAPQPGTAASPDYDSSTGTTTIVNDPGYVVAPPPLPLPGSGSSSAPVVSTSMSPTTAVPGTVYVPKYVGCISRYHKTRRTFSIYCPIGWQPRTLGSWTVLGDDKVTPAPPPNTMKIAEEAVEPPEAPSNGATEDDFKFYKSPWFWAGVAMVGIGGTTAGMLLYRRRRP